MPNLTMTDLEDLLRTAQAEQRHHEAQVAYLDTVIHAVGVVTEYATSLGWREQEPETTERPPAPPAPAADPDEGECVHHWVCEEQNGPTSEAKCNKCGATQTLRNSADETAWSKSTTTIKGRIHLMLREQAEVTTDEIMANLDAEDMTYSVRNLGNHVRFAGGEPVPGKRGYWRLRTDEGANE